MFQTDSFESLETRRLFSAISLSKAGVLNVDGNGKTANTITVAEDTAGAILTASIQSGNSTLTKTFKVTAVKKLSIDGGDKADTINVGQTGKSFAIATLIYAHEGADKINTGDENDTIHAGDGNDVVNAGAGNDLVYSGSGNDSIHGNDGNDSLWGEGGKDSIYGDAGNDTLGGVVGVNTVFGGTGNDVFYVNKTLAGSDPVNDFDSTMDTLHVKPVKP